MRILNTVNDVIAVIFTVCYAYQFFYLAAALLKKEKTPPEASRLYNYAVLICARNEEKVIGDLLDSLKKQSYPQELLHVFVMADNCTDRTAEIAASRGACVYCRSSRTEVGKGYALRALLQNIQQHGIFDGYFVFDADNILSGDYVEQMNRTFSAGHEIVTSYRNSKNYGSNWISAGYALWFLRESRYLNGARFALGTSCAVSGTGFLFSRKVLDETGLWPFHLLTEDLEFTIDRVTAGQKIAYCPDAELFDEQPTGFRQSWRQRMRWTQGYLQVLAKYGGNLLKGVFHGSFSCYDMAMSIMPAFILSAVSLLCNLVLGIAGLCSGESLRNFTAALLMLPLGSYGMLFLIGAVTTLSEWKHIRTSPGRKILYALTFPLFMFTYIPIAISSVFCKAEWKPIDHTLSVAAMQEKGMKTP